MLPYVCDALEDTGICCEIDNRDEKIGYKICEAQLTDRVPYMLIIGQKEADTQTVSVRSRDSAQNEIMELQAFIKKVTSENQPLTSKKQPVT